MVISLRGEKHVQHSCSLWIGCNKLHLLLQKGNIRQVFCPLLAQLLLQLEQLAGLAQLLLPKAFNLGHKGLDLTVCSSLQFFLGGLLALKCLPEVVDLSRNRGASRVTQHTWML